MLQEKKDEAYKLGQLGGLARGSWVIDGNTSVTACENIIKGYEDGDPQVMEMCPSPLSAEWADEPAIGSLMSQLGVKVDTRFEQKFCDMYEDGFEVAWWDEVLRAARYQVA